MKRNRIVLIIPYFGNFNNYFEFWKTSAMNNENIDFLLITDNKKPSISMKNIIWIEEKFDSLREKIRMLVPDINIVLNKPYKLCEYKVLYGKLFEKYISEYEFWGYCDIDLIFGNTKKFITDEILNNYDKLYSRGHLTIYRNNDFFRHFYMIDDPRMRVTYKEAWTTNHCVHFDELPCWNEVLEERGIRCYEQVDFADLCIDSFRFKLAMERQESFARQIFGYYDGELKRIYINRDNIITEENVLYVHLQKRDMIVSTNKYENYLIVPNQFTEVRDITPEYLIANSPIKMIWLKYCYKRICEIKKNIQNGAIKVRLIVYKRKLIQKIQRL